MTSMSSYHSRARYYLALATLAVPRGSGLFVSRATGEASDALTSAIARATQKGAARQLLFRGFPDEVVARSLLTLDTNHDGCIDPREVMAFATAQGLNADSVSREFASLDTNGDGVLDSKELATALGTERPGVKSVAKGASLATASSGPTAAPVAGQTLSQSGPAAPAQEASAREAAHSHAAGSEVSAAALAELLALQEKLEKEAQALENSAADLRANATALARAAKEQALLEGEQAASAKAAELLHSITDLDGQAQGAEVEAAALRAKSQAEQVHADGLMAVTDSALRLDTDPSSATVSAQRAQ